MAYLQEPSYSHGTISGTAVVLVNLGTPEAPTASAVRRYLKQFLSDPRVVEIPRLAWLPILHGITLPLRSGQSAKKYASIWSREGSPLKVHTERQAALLQAALTRRGHQLRVTYAMRYGSPSLPEVMESLRAQACDRILILPAYPQYSGTTTASVFDAVFAHLGRLRNTPELRLVKHYHDHEGYIGALADKVLAHWDVHGQPQRLVLSFHGVPKRTLMLGDPYHCECQKTARLLAARLQLPPEQCLVTFQSRFGKAEWLQPYTAPTLQKLAQEGVKRVDVMCPGFTSDCLETLEEIAMEARHDFLAAGGQEFHYISCLNEDPGWIAALAEIAEQHLIGWRTVPTSQSREEILRDAEIARAQALGLGADK